MFQVDFYLLEQQTAGKLYPFACRLLEKVLSQAESIFVAHNNLEECYQFNEFLWSYRDNSFIPHCLSSDTIALETPVVLGTMEKLDLQKIVLNFCHEIPKQTNQIKRVLEIVPDEPSWRALARKKFLLYKNLTSEIKTHKL